MLTIGALPMTLPLVITATIFASVDGGYEVAHLSLRDDCAPDRHVGLRRVRRFAEPVVDDRLQLRSGQLLRIGQGRDVRRHAALPLLTVTTGRAQANCTKSRAPPADVRIDRRGRLWERRGRGRHG